MKVIFLVVNTIVLLLFPETIAKSQNIVVSNNPDCTKIAEQLIDKGGNAREVFIGVSLCEGLVHPMDSGLGGGFQALYYSKTNEKKTALYINSREQSPSNPEFAEYELIEGNSIGIPSVLKGYETLYNLDKTNNNLKWSEIIEPVIALCENGYQMSRTTRGMFEIFKSFGKNYDTVLNIDWEKNIVQNPLFCKLLRQISKDGPSSSLYKKKGKLHKLLMKDLAETTSFITSKDVRNYKVKVIAPATAKFDKYTVYSTRIPGSGYAVLFALKMMEKIKSLMKKDVSETHKVVYLLKILKYTYALQPHVRELTNKTIHEIVNKGGRILGSGIIKGGTTIQQTIPRKFGSVKLAAMQSPLSIGTTNVVIKVGNSSISATSTINHSFGSGILSKRMGIFYNNQMRDFSNPNWRRKNKVVRNAPGANKIPSSSISGLIMVDKNGVPVFQIGAAGGGKILSAIVNTLYNYFVLNMTLEGALQKCRFTPKLNFFQNKVKYMYECIENESVAVELREKGVDFQKVVESGYSAATAISAIKAESEGVFDQRRGGLALLS